MVDWNSATELATDSAAFTKFMHTLLGLYIWEWFTTLDFDFAFLTGRKRFRWPLTFYFLGRYCLLFALMGITIALDVTKEVNCQALYTFNQCFGNFAIGMASVNLSVRTMAIWSQKWYIVCPLIAVILGHWSLLLHGILLKAAWVEGTGCVITSTDSTLLAASFIYTMAFDFMVLTLTAWKLAFPKGGRSRLVEMIFGDGLVYFLVAFLANMTATVFMLLNLNAVMSVIANVPAAVISTIVACRVVRRLNNFANQGPEVFTSSSPSTNNALRFNSGTASRGPANVSVARSTAGGVHVQMDTFSVADKVTYDASGRVVSAEGKEFDPESQQISDEFKHQPY